MISHTPYRSMRSVQWGSESNCAASLWFCASAACFFSQDFLWLAIPSDLKRFPQWGHSTWGAINWRGVGWPPSGLGEICRFQIELEFSGVKDNAHDTKKILQPIINDLRDSTTNQHEINKRFISDFSEARSQFRQNFSDIGSACVSLRS
jgi:hypothetical protein